MGRRRTRTQGRGLRARGLLRPLLLGGCLLVSACGGGGGGGGGGSEDATPAVPRVAVTGSVYAGPVAGASVRVVDAAGRTVAGPVTTNVDGTYRIDVPTSALSGDLDFQASGGTFTDEATSAAGVQAGNLSAYAFGGTLQSGSAVHLNPATAILGALVRQHGKSRSQAANLFGAAFGFTPDLSRAPANAPAATVGQAEALAGLRSAAFSQLTADLELPSPRQFDLLAALAADLADGALDGKPSAASVTLPEDVQNRYAQALASFRGGVKDRTGLAADQIGFLPAASVALSPAYRISYAPDPARSGPGKTAFTLRVTRRDGQALPAAAAVSLQPVMHMADTRHETPAGAVQADGAGGFACAVYYVMGSGPGLGYWSLAIEVSAPGSQPETVTLYPTVPMPSYALLKGSAELTADGADRVYYLFNEGLTEGDGGQTHRLTLFAATKESPSDYRTLETGLVLEGPAGTSETVASVSVWVSTDAVSWTPAADLGAGRWEASGLTGIDPTRDVALHVRLEVNGRRKVDGAAGLATPRDYAALTLAGEGSCCQ